MLIETVEVKGTDGLGLWWDGSGLWKDKIRFREETVKV